MVRAAQLALPIGDRARRNEINATTAKRNAEDKRKLVMQLNSEANAIEASIKYVEAEEEKRALRRNLNNYSINGGLRGGDFRYARQDERERTDQDSGMAWVPGLSQRDQRSRQDFATVGASQAGEPQAGLFGVRSEDR